MSDPTSPISYTFEVPARPPVYIVAPRPRRPYWLHILLLLVTLFTTLTVGARLQYNFLHNLPAFSDDSVVLPLFHLKWLVQHPANLVLGIPFSMTLMGILLAHEFGHFVVAKRNGVYATLPYFIPAPTLIGTFGAVIRIKSPIRSRQALFDIGIAGPIAGFLVALPVLFWGLALSKPMPPMAADSALSLGYPLVFGLVHRALVPFTPHAISLGSLYLHPVGIAAWVGMFATALNLLPGGQLDGGHIIYAVAPRAHKWVTRACILALIPLGIFYWPGWMVWALILGFTGLRHPNVPQWPPLDTNRRWLVLLAVLLLALTFALAPIRGGSLFGS
jgi:membrane-associated protease RseP (regulator of RpoE activity)